jgi:hypothetical protein
MLARRDQGHLKLLIENDIFELLGLMSSFLFVEEFGRCRGKEVDFVVIGDWGGAHALPAIGTRSVLEQIHEASSIQQVRLTRSITALIFHLGIRSFGAYRTSFLSDVPSAPPDAKSGRIVRDTSCMS